jgi:hypothetical protein
MVNAPFDHLLLVSVNPEVFPFWGERPDLLPIILHTHAGVALRARVDIIRSHGFSSVFYNLGLALQRHLQNMLFYHKGLRVYKKSLSFVTGDRKAAILRVQIWSAH